MEVKSSWLEILDINFEFEKSSRALSWRLLNNSAVFCGYYLSYFPVFFLSVCMCFFLLSCQAESWCPPPSLPVLHHMKILPSSSCIRAWRGFTAFSTSTHRAYRSCWSLPSGKAASDLLVGLPVSLRQVHGWQPSVALLVLCPSVSPSFGSYNFLMNVHRRFLFHFCGKSKIVPFALLFSMSWGLSFSRRDLLLVLCWVLITVPLTKCFGILHEFENQRFSWNRQYHRVLLCAVG